MAYTVIAHKRIDATALTKEARRRVPALGAGLTAPSVQELGGTVTFQGDFTDADRAALDAVIAAHDADAIVSARAARIAFRASERAKRPETLTLPERVRRLETMLDLD